MLDLRGLAPLRAFPPFKSLRPMVMLACFLLPPNSDQLAARLSSNTGVRASVVESFQLGKGISDVDRPIKWIRPCLHEGRGGSRAGAGAGAGAGALSRLAVAVCCRCRCLLSLSLSPVARHYDIFVCSLTILVFMLRLC